MSHDNGNKFKGPVTPQSEQQIRDAEVAEALALIIPPHTSCLANEERTSFYRLYDNLIAKYRPADEAEYSIVRDIADYQWKALRNNQTESAIFNREIVRQGQTIRQGSIPELRDIEISVAAQEALTGNKTIAELRRDSVRCLRAVSILQHRLKELQKTWPQAAPISTMPARTQSEAAPEATGPIQQEAAKPARVFNINGPATENVANLYRNIFGVKDAEFVSHPLDDAA